MQIEFETAKKEKAIAEKNLEIKNKNLFTFILISIFVLISILFWGNYKRNKLKRAQLEKEILLRETLAAIETKNKLQEQRLEISRDLHDNIGSQLTFIISSIDNLKYVSKNLSNTLQEKPSGISGFTAETIHQLRNTIWAMNKAEISFDELQSRLLSYFEKAKIAANDIQFHIKAESINHQFNSVEGINLFRVIQEAVNNSIKYANATDVEVTFSKQNHMLIITISDNGIGFKKEEITQGNGLLNMENRINKMNGVIEINSVKEKGTDIVIKLTIE